ncbi:hypothetical protein A2783_01490 [Microgenomates group bacterium RIFCSPHIGHO2_01_FULL_45_11]|nr:MAG: hypothetical protein A2783_01490 [Microgenomates group bacterium RIFCSPHIGHO2_01_FULL_45_11]
MSDLPKKLPRFTYRYFWNVDPAKIQISQSLPTVLEVLLERGNLRTYRWIIKNIPVKKIAETVRRSRQLRRKTATFWARYLKLDNSEVKCLSPEYRQLPSKPFYG